MQRSGRSLAGSYGRLPLLKTLDEQVSVFTIDTL